MVFRRLCFLSKICLGSLLFTTLYTFNCFCRFWTKVKISVFTGQLRSNSISYIPLKIEQFKKFVRLSKLGEQILSTILLLQFEWSFSKLYLLQNVNIENMLFCYQNCSHLLWEKNVLVIKKNFWNSRLKAKNLQKFWDH